MPKHCGDEANLSAEARRLAVYMEDISETCWHAGWMSGLEFVLWHAVQNGPILRYAHGSIEEEHIAELRRLSAECGGWIRFPDEDNERVFIPMAEWIKIYFAESNLAPFI